MFSKKCYNLSVKPIAEKCVSDSAEVQSSPFGDLSMKMSHIASMKFEAILIEEREKGNFFVSDIISYCTKMQ